MRSLFALSLFVFATLSLGCEQWANIRRRCQSWVDQRLPYSQTTTHDGYRLDCSGMASWCIYGGTGAHKPGLVTSTFPNYGQYITKEQLRPGHLMLNSRQHVLMFAGWANSDHSQYYAYEECTRGAVYRATQYPYWSGYDPQAYKPFKTTDVAVC